MRFEHEPLLMQLILKRLSVMEVLASIKFKTLPVEDCKREEIILTDLRIKSQITGYSIQQSTMIERFFSANMSLAKCIQRACFDQWENLSEDVVKNIGLALAGEMGFEQSVKMESLRLYIIDVTNAMFDALKFIQTVPDFQKLFEPIMMYFPRVNAHDLKKIIATMTKSMTEFVSLSTLG